MRILATLLRPDGGRAAVTGHDVVRKRRQVRRAVSLTGHYPAVDEPQTGAENLAMTGRLSWLAGSQARRRAGQLLEAFDLAPAAGRRVAAYSGGMRRRLDVAASLVTRRPAGGSGRQRKGLDRCPLSPPGQGSPSTCLSRSLSPSSQPNTRRASARQAACSTDDTLAAVVGSRYGASTRSWLA